MPDADVPEDVVNEAERLTRLAREVVDDEEAATYRERRDDLLDDHGYVARVRDDDDGATLVCYPDEWVEDGVVRTERIDDVDRGIERSLAGAGDPEAWSDVDEHNRELVARVAEEHGEVHAANVDAFADFMSNHYAKPLERATRDEIEEFLTEYYPRNVWPSADQRAVVETSVELAFDVAGTECPYLT